MDLMAILSLPAEVQRRRGFRTEALVSQAWGQAQDSDEKEPSGDETTVPRRLNAEEDQ